MTVDPRVLATFNRQTMATRTRVQEFAARQFAAGQYRDADVARFVSQVSPVVLAGRRQVSAMTDAYLTQTLKSSGIKPPRLGPIDTSALRGVPVQDVYARPYQSVWTSLSNGNAYGDAIAAGAARLSGLIATDMQMAKTYTSRDVLSHSKGVTGYMRTPSGVNTCALCEVASTMVYHREDLMPIHPGCGCGVEPITETNPWDQEAADQRLMNAHASVQDQLGMSDPGARGPDYRKVIAVREHGEIGPMLTRAGDRFTGPNLVAEKPLLAEAPKPIEVPPPLTYSIEHLTDEAADKYAAELAEKGDWAGSERVMEQMDARVTARGPWKPDPIDPFNTETYDWFQKLSEAEQYAFMDKLPSESRFAEQQWAWANAKTVVRDVMIPTERQIRAEWDAYIDRAWVELEDATRGTTLSREAQAAGRLTRDLFRANPATARKWASEETLRYWDEKGRMTYEAFKAGYTRNRGAIEAAGKAYWAA